jgi:hypothetical protein
MTTTKGFALSVAFHTVRNMETPVSKDACTNEMKSTRSSFSVKQGQIGYNKKVRKEIYES